MIRFIKYIWEDIIEENTSVILIGIAAIIVVVFTYTFVNYVFTEHRIISIRSDCSYIKIVDPEEYKKIENKCNELHKENIKKAMNFILKELEQ